MSSDKKQEASLVTPDFTGLWSVAWTGRSNALGYKLWAFFCMLLFVGAWTLGTTCLWWLPLLAYSGYYTTVAVLLAVIAFPDVFDIRKGWPLGIRLFVLPGAHWYDGGCSMSYELPPDGFEKQCTDEVSKQTPVLHTYHPHGIFTQAYQFNAGNRFYVAMNESEKELRAYYGGERMNDARDVFGPLDLHIGIIADALYYLPFWRLIGVKWSQSVAPSNKAAVRKLMKSGESLLLLPGGVFEATITCYKKEQIYITNVKGFVKYALQFGYRLIPCYTFGECRAYRNCFNWLGCDGLKKWLNARGIPTVIPFGKWFCPILPLNSGVGIHTVCGYDKRLPKIPEPTQAEIDEWHAWYVAEIKALFERNKHRFGMDEEQLTVC